MIGAPGRTRTCNRRIRSPVLYPVELRARDAVSTVTASTVYGAGREIIRASAASDERGLSVSDPI